MYYSCSLVMSTTNTTDFGKQNDASDMQTKKNTQISIRKRHGQRDQNIKLERQNPEKRRILQDCVLDITLILRNLKTHISAIPRNIRLEWALSTVSSLAFQDTPIQTSGNRLLAGFSRGLIVMFDSKTGTVLRNLFDCVTPNSGVLNLKWTEKPALALASDSGGSVWSLNFTRKFGKRGCVSKCLFSGAKGEVCAIEPLIIEDNSANNHNVTNLEQYSIIALATLSKYFVITVRPRLKVIKFHMLNGPPDSLPLLSWQMVLIQSMDSHKSVYPVLAVARGNHLCFHQIFVSQGRINLLFLRHINLNYDLLALHWLGPRVIGCVDKSEVLHLITVSSSKEEELLDLGSTGLVYGSSQFKGLATGGNVSPALSLAGNFACYNSIISSRFQHIYVLGARSVQMITIRNWNERISFLMKNKRWTEAFVLALEEFKIARKRENQRKESKEILQIVIKCLIEVNDLGSLWEYIDIGSSLSRSDLNLFLMIIAEFIEKDYITKVSPSISKLLVEYWLDLDVDKLEEMLLKLEWTCLDLNQVFRIVKDEKLYRAQIHLNANALGDYSTILMELIPKIGENGSTDRTLGNYILVYISCCLAGRAYPVGEIAMDKVSSVKHDVLRSLTSAHSILNADGELQYPYLRGLLEFDTRETLNVLALAFQEKEFQDEMGNLHKKRIVRILLEIMSGDRVHFLVKEEMYESIFDCYLPNPLRHDELFTYIENNAALPKMKVFEQIESNLLQLLEINASQIVRLIVDNYYEKFDEFLEILNENRQFLYLFMKISLSLGITLNSQMSEKYLRLLGEFEPFAILPFLETTDNYKIENAIEILKSLADFPGKTQCTIFLLEKQGDYQQAFDLSIKQLKEFDDVEGSLKVAAFCSRAVKALDEDGTEFWFRFLEIILSRGEYKVIKKRILHEAKKYVNLVKLVQLCWKIIENDLHEKFDDLKKKSNRGILVTVVRCVECRQKLYSPDSDIVVIGKCGHAVHEKCAETFKCTFCNNTSAEEGLEEVDLSKPNVELFDKQHFLNYSF
uniref:Vacuolar protein sorting-associated protein 8 central domain-containing protein n=1 Tax=Megaselia scalaris TaxID=36166 RepID=T1GCW8_MEGSC